MNEPSPLYRMVEKRLDVPLAEWVAERRATASWDAMAAELQEQTDLILSGETLRRWFADRITVEVKVA